MAEADKYINETGLQTIKTWIKSTFGLKSDLETLTGRVDDIVAEGGEPNVIETVKVNGIALTPDAQKAVNLNGATQQQTTRWYIRDYRDGDKILEISSSNDGVDILSTSNGFDQNDWAKNLVSKNYVDANGGKIDVIKVNGDEQTITNKEVDLSVPRVTFTPGDDTVDISDGVNSVSFTQNGQMVQYDYNSFTTILVNRDYVDTTFQTPAKVQEQIDAALEGITGVDFQVVTELPTTGVKGVIYLVHKGGTSADIYDEYIWVTPESGTARYEQIGTTDIDLSDYWSKTELTAMTVSEINSILNA